MSSKAIVMAEDSDARPAQSSHRLPTVSASQALQRLTAGGGRSVSTGLRQLDQVLAPASLPGQHVEGGYARGKVTEVYGPSGVGKTSLLLQAASNALREGHDVYWLDGACAPLVAQRLHAMLSSSSSSSSSRSSSSSSSSITTTTNSAESAPAQLCSRFHHHAAPTLAHVLALLLHPPPAFPNPRTSLVVIDSLSTLIDNAYPRNTDDRPKTKSDQSKWAAARRYAVINDLIAALTSFAALHHLALVVTCQTITRIRGSSRALLVPAISGLEWENGISARLLLFRDWLPQHHHHHHHHASDNVEADKLHKTRFAGLVKLNGVALADEGGVGNVVPFAIDTHGLCDINLIADDTATTTMVSPVQPRPSKRTFDEIDDNVAEEPNSDDVYGWLEDDAVAAEGLLIHDVPPTTDGDAQPEPAAQDRSAKITRIQPE